VARREDSIWEVCGQKRKKSRPNQTRNDFYCAASLGGGRKVMMKESSVAA